MEMQKGSCCCGCPVTMAAKILVLIGGINWGFWGAFHFNLVDTLVGGVQIVERIIYSLVGLAAVFLIVKMGMMMSGKCKDGSCEIKK